MPATKASTATKKPPAPQAIRTASPDVKGELQVFTALLDAIRPIAIETTHGMEGEMEFGSIRLYELLRLYCAGEWEREIQQRQEDREALAATPDPTTQRHLQVVHSNQAVLRFYRWLAENGFVSRKDYEQVLALAKGTIGSVLA